jgi:DNA repair protein RecO (recombination protein O)
LLSVCRIVFIRKSADVLDLLTEAKLERRFRAAGRDLNRLYAGYYVSELLNELTDPHDPHPELFDAADQALRALDGDSLPASAVLWFELQTLTQVGHAPSLETCAACGREIELAARVPFGLVAGGVLCGDCRTGQRQVVSVSSASLQALQALARQDGWRHLLAREQGGELRGLMNTYLSHLTGHRLRLHPYLNGLAAAE